MKITVSYLLYVFFWLSVVCTPSFAFAEEESYPAYDYNSAYEGEVYDPWEKMNRKIYKFNDALDKAVLQPVARGYRKAVPKPARKGIRNFLSNLTEPLTLINSTLQGDIVHSMSTFWRFTINSTIGVGGLFDVAGKYTPFKNRKEDFGQTLGAHGTGKGPYIMIPLLGPSNGRDAFGKIVDIFTDPFNHVANGYNITARTLVSSIDKREAYLDVTDEVERVSLDAYASIRSLYTQSRNNEIKNGAVYKRID